MKKITSIMMALMIVLGLSQCKKPVENNDNNPDVPKVKVSCSIPINDGGKSDFSNLMETGKVNWSDGRECIYLAVHGDDSQIIELEGWSDGTPSNLEFTGEVTEGLIISGEEYDIWYFGHSQQLATPHISNNGSTLTGSIANQSGRLADLGYCHIAKATVMAETDSEGVKLNLTGVLKNQMAIALLDLENVTELYGNAIRGTEYTLAYNGERERYELNVEEDDEASIAVESSSGISYVVLLPNEGEGVSIKHKKGEDTYSYTFRNGIASSKIYYRSGLDGTTPEALEWKEISEIDGHEYVDLGLTSGLLWATCNVGANTPEACGNYYAWGETTTKAEYIEENNITYDKQLNDISGCPQYDAAAANWGGAWRMPSKAAFDELLSECTWEKTTMNGVNGYKFTSKTNGNYIFLPSAGIYRGTSISGKNNRLYYWSSTITYDSGVSAIVYGLNDAFVMFLGFGTNGMMQSYLGQQIRPVTGGNFDGPLVQYAFVETAEITEITSNSALCGGEVTTDSGSEVVERGVCWSKTYPPTIEDDKISSGSGVGAYTVNLTDLEPNTTYYVRAYATNEAGTSYGKIVEFKTSEIPNKYE